MEITLKESKKTAVEEVKVIQNRIVEKAFEMLLSIIAMIKFIPTEDVWSVLIVVTGLALFFKTLREIINSSTELILVLIEHGKLS